MLRFPYEAVVDGIARHSGVVARTCYFVRSIPLTLKRR